MTFTSYRPVFLGVFHDFWYNRSIKNREETAIHNLEERIEWFDGKSFQSRVKEETAFVQKVFEGIG